MNLVQIQERIALAKGYRAICDSKLSRSRHHFDDDLKFYKEKKEHYDNLIEHLHNQQGRIIKRRITATLAVAHVIVIGLFLVLYFPIQ